MRPKILEETLLFLRNLSKNNNRDWFNDNKPKYETAKVEFEQFISELIAEIAQFDKSIAHQEAKKCIFRIYRDVRFSKNKSPYKIHMGAHITPARNKSDSGAGYYVHIEPGASMLAGGAYQPEAFWLKNIRQEIDYNSELFRKIIEDRSFKKIFGKIEGERLIRLPKGYSADNPEIELLKLKSFIAVHNLEDNLLSADTFFEHTLNVFKVLHPFDVFLNRALD